MTIGNNLNSITLNLQENLAKLSLAEKLEDESNNPLYTELQSSISSQNAEVKNLNEAVGFMQIADGALSSLSEQTMQLEELSVSRNSGALNSSQRSMIDSQMGDIQESMNRTISESSYNGLNVFNSGAFNESGLNISIDTNNLDISSVDSISQFRDAINSNRSEISSFMNSATSEIDNLSTTVVNESEAKSNLEVDFAEEAMDFKNNNLLLDASLIAQSHNMDLLKNNLSSLLA
jgi:flagellin